MTPDEVRALIDDAVAPLDAAGPPSPALLRSRRRRARQRAGLLTAGAAVVAVVAVAAGLQVAGARGTDSAGIAESPRPAPSRAARDDGVWLRAVFPFRTSGEVERWEAAPTTAYGDPVSTAQAWARERLNVPDALVSPRDPTEDDPGRWDVAVPGSPPRVVATLTIRDAGTDDEPGPYVVELAGGEVAEISDPLPGADFGGFGVSGRIAVTTPTRVHLTLADATLAVTDEEVTTLADGTFDTLASGSFIAPLNGGPGFVEVVARDRDGRVVGAASVPVSFGPLRGTTASSTPTGRESPEPSAFPGAATSVAPS